MDDLYYMHAAIRAAEEAFSDGEVPVGCVIADENGEIIGIGRNMREKKHDATAHAEIEAIRDACSRREGWRLENCTIYVTLEPCPMCAGAIINSRISRVVYGAREPLTGSCGSVIDIFFENYGHTPQVISGICAEESTKLLKCFFHNKR